MSEQESAGRREVVFRQASFVEAGAPAGLREAGGASPQAAFGAEARLGGQCPAVQPFGRAGQVLGQVVRQPGERERSGRGSVAAYAERGFEPPAGEEPFRMAPERTSEPRERHFARRPEVFGRRLLPFDAGAERIAAVAAPPFDGRFGPGLPDAVLVHRLPVHGRPLSGAVGDHFDPQPLRAGRIRPEAPASGAVGDVRFAPLRAEGADGDGVVRSVVPVRGEPAVFGAGVPPFGTVRHELRRHGVSAAGIGGERAARFPRVALQDAAQSGHEELAHGVGFVEEGDSRVLFVEPSPEVEDQHAASELHAGAEPDREVRDDVVRPGIDLPVLLRGAVVAPQGDVEAADPPGVAAAEGVLLGREVAAHGIRHDIGIEQQVVGRGVPADVAAVAAHVPGVGPDDAPVVEVAETFGVESAVERSVAERLQPRLLLPAQIHAHGQLRERPVRASERGGGRRFVEPGRGVLRLRLGERCAFGDSRRVAPERRRVGPGGRREGQQKQDCQQCGFHGVGSHRLAWSNRTADSCPFTHVTAFALSLAWSAQYSRRVVPSA